MKNTINETHSIRRMIFIVESKNKIDAVARTVLSEGTEYNTYVALTEAPIGDVIGKIKSGLRQLPSQAASKISNVIKSLPKTALPMVAAVLISATSGANAQDIDVSALSKQVDQIAQQMGSISAASTAITTDVIKKHTTAEWTDKNTDDMKQYVSKIWNEQDKNYWIDSTRKYLDQPKLQGTSDADFWLKQIDKLERYINDGFSEPDIRTVNLTLQKDPQMAIDYVTKRGLQDTTTGQNIIKLANKKMNKG